MTSLVLIPVGGGVFLYELGVVQNAGDGQIRATWFNEAQSLSLDFRRSSSTDVPIRLIRVAVLLAFGLGKLPGAIE